MVRVKVLHGFTDANKNNFQDNEIIDLSAERYEKLKGSFVELFSEPVAEVDNKELKVKIKELEKIIAERDSKIEELEKMVKKSENPETDKDKENAKVQK